MKSRVTAWVSALLLFSAVFGLPVTHTAYTNQASCYYVYSQQRERRAEQVVETAAARRPEARPYVAGAGWDRCGAVLLDFALFQRPPPNVTL